MIKYENRLILSLTTRDKNFYPKTNIGDKTSRPLSSLSPSANEFQYTHLLKEDPVHSTELVSVLGFLE